MRALRGSHSIRAVVIAAAALGMFAAGGGGTVPAQPQAGGAAFRSAWPMGIERIWAGPEYWANRLQDWRVKNGRLECLPSLADRNVHLLTRRVGSGQGSL
ncbi:MAG: hypothetical protein NTZ26_15745, partial [Candidatus Aminicenantes bacterium]|nr:hypothetical protein [Candidatus Aminicenantes bacterium]